MRQSTLPPVRVAPSERALIESVLVDGETLSAFIVQAVTERAKWRLDDAAFHAEADRRAQAVASGEMGTVTAAQSVARIRGMVAAAKAAKA